MRSSNGVEESSPSIQPPVKKLVRQPRPTPHGLSYVGELLTSIGMLAVMVWMFVEVGQYTLQHEILIVLVAATGLGPVGMILEGLGNILDQPGRLLYGLGSVLAGLALALLIASLLVDGNLSDGMIALSFTRKCLWSGAVVAFGVAMVLFIQGNSSSLKPFWGQRWWVQTLIQHGISDPFLRPVIWRKFSYKDYQEELENVAEWSVSAQDLLLGIGAKIRKPSTLGLNWLTIIATILFSLTDFVMGPVSWVYDGEGFMFLIRLFILSAVFLSLVGIIAGVNFQVNKMLFWVQEKTISVNNLRLQAESGEETIDQGITRGDGHRADQTLITQLFAVVGVWSTLKALKGGRRRRPLTSAN